jgi:hypothetical protein
MMRDQRNICLERQDFISTDGVALSKVRAINRASDAAWVVVRHSDGRLDPWFVSERSRKTIVFASERSEVDKLSFLVSPTRNESLMPWPVQGGAR